MGKLTLNDFGVTFDPRVASAGVYKPIRIWWMCYCKRMNGHKWTACFAKGMRNYTVTGCSETIYI